MSSVYYHAEIASSEMVAYAYIVSLFVGQRIT